MFDWIENVLVHEGLFSDRNSDRGGRTFRGITWRTYCEYCKRNELTPTRFHHENLIDEEVMAVYISLFVKPYRIEEYESDWLKEAVFSAAINHGGPQAAYMVQKSANQALQKKLKVDGIVGSKTLAAVNGLPAVSFVNSLAIQRILFVDKIIVRTVGQGDDSQVDNLVGWHNRYTRFIKPKLEDSQ